MHTFHLAPATGLLLLVAITTLWLLAKQLAFSLPITAAKIVDMLLFVLLLIWFVVSIVHLA